jgi:hypothetical protein
MQLSARLSKTSGKENTNSRHWKRSTNDYEEDKIAFSCQKTAMCRKSRQKTAKTP